MRWYFGLDRRDGKVNCARKASFSDDEKDAFVSMGALFSNIGASKIGNLIFLRRDAHLFPEYFRKIALAWKSKNRGNFCRAHLRINEHVAGSLDFFVLDIAADCLAGFLFEKL